jgi:hypothetical protein
MQDSFYFTFMTFFLPFTALYVLVELSQALQTIFFIILIASKEKNK